MPCAVILTALSVECLAVCAHLSNLKQEVHPQGTIYERGQFDSSKDVWDVAVLEIGAGNPGVHRFCKGTVAMTTDPPLLTCLSFRFSLTG